jgi:hypothetical protein
VSDDLTLLVNEERTVLVSIWATGEVTVALRDEAGHIWGPPITVKEEN